MTHKRKPQPPPGSLAAIVQRQGPGYPNMSKVLRWVDWSDSEFARRLTAAGVECSRSLVGHIRLGRREPSAQFRLVAPILIGRELHSDADKIREEMFGGDRSDFRPLTVFDTKEG